MHSFVRGRVESKEAGLAGHSRFSAAELLAKLRVLHDKSRGRKVLRNGFEWWYILSGIS